MAKVWNRGDFENSIISGVKITLGGLITINNAW
jgi:hypothetical protein